MPALGALVLGDVFVASMTAEAGRVGAACLDNGNGAAARLHFVHGIVIWGITGSSGLKMLAACLFACWQFREVEQPGRALLC